MIHLKEVCLLIVIVTQCQLGLGSKDVGKVQQSRLILEYNWPKMIKGLKRLPHVVSCDHFYLTKPDGTHVIKKCPDGEGYDFKSRRCMERIVARCWSKQFKTDLESQFVCPFPWGLYPDIVDCSSFFNCLNGQFYVRKCPVDSLFDKAERKCVPAKQAMCADETDVVQPGYKCPYTWGFFTYPKDCSKYYECLQKNPSVRSCKRNMLFDNRKRKCLPKSKVECGARFNPYENFETSAGNSELTTRLMTSTEAVSTAENISRLTGGYSYTNSRRSGSPNPITKDNSRSTEGFYNTDHSRRTGSPAIDKSHSTGGFSYTDSRRTGSPDPITEDNSRSTGGVYYTDHSRRTGSSYPITKDNSHSTGGFYRTYHSRRTGSLDPITKDNSHSTGRFYRTDHSRRTGSPDHTINDNPRSTGGFYNTDLKRVSSSDRTIEDISRLTRDFTPTYSKRIGSSDTTVQNAFLLTGEFILTNSKV